MCWYQREANAPTFDLVRAPASNPPTTVVSKTSASNTHCSYDLREPVALQVASCEYAQALLGPQRPGGPCKPCIDDDDPQTAWHCSQVHWCAHCVGTTNCTASLLSCKPITSCTASMLTGKPATNSTAGSDSENSRNVEQGNGGKTDGGDMRGGNLQSFINVPVETITQPLSSPVTHS